MQDSKINSEIYNIPENSSFYIYGSGALGRYVYEKIQEYRSDLTILGFIDKKAESADYEEYGLIVTSFEKWLNASSSDIYIATNAYYTDVVEMLREQQLEENILNYRAELLGQDESVDEDNDITLRNSHEVFMKPGPGFEEFDAVHLDNNATIAKLIAVYLPQFYPFPENDNWWGTGFTEWRNVTRGHARFNGHFQPRLPRDLGYYDLRRTEVLEQQVRLARESGIHGFCFYYYNFNNKRLLDIPLDNFVNNESIDFPFCIMWANENWTRRWDGMDEKILIKQEYDEQNDLALIADISRYLKHPEYIHRYGQPLFFIYNPREIPNAKDRISRWRELFSQQGVEPLIYMVQRLMDDDPLQYGLDGALELPPHKLSSTLPLQNLQLTNKAKDFDGNYYSYEHLIEESLSQTSELYPLIKTVIPDWDNEARRPNKGHGFVGSTPEKFQQWLTDVIRLSQQTNDQEDAIVFINAWNEWAEGAYLEPDVYWGSAYLNAIKRCLNAL